MKLKFRNRCSDFVVLLLSIAQIITWWHNSYAISFEQSFLFLYWPLSVVYIEFRSIESIEDLVILSCDHVHLVLIQKYNTVHNITGEPVSQFVEEKSSWAEDALWWHRRRRNTQNTLRNHFTNRCQLTPSVRHLLRWRESGYLVPYERVN